MGKIGCKVGQCDSVMDFCVEFRDYGLMGGTWYFRKRIFLVRFQKNLNRRVLH